MRPVVVLLFLSLLVYAPILVNNGIFWDDWTLFNMSREGLDEMFMGAGAYYLAGVHYYLQQVSEPVLLYKLLTCLLSAVSVILFYKILSRFEEIGGKEQFYIAAIFTVAPFFAAKVTMICLPYTICVCLFLLAFYFFIQVIDKPNLLLRILSILFFFISFITNSLLFFYLIVPLYVWYARRGSTVRQVFIEWSKFTDFMVLPIVYWIVKSMYFQPTHFYALRNYNAIELKRLFYLPIQFMATLSETFLGILSLFYENVYSYFLLAIVLALGIVGRRLHVFDSYILNPINRFTNNSNNKKILIIGTLLLFIGVFPYLLVGKAPSFVGYETRHQLLLPIGFSIIIVALISLLVIEKYRSLIFFTVIIVLVTVNMQLQYRYLIGWFKQESIMANLKLIPLPLDVNTFEVEDNTEFYNATNWSLNFYEWGGLAKAVSGSENRLFISKDLWGDIPKGGNLVDFVKLRIQNRAMIQRNMRNYFPDGSCQKIIVNSTDYNLASGFQVLKLLRFYYFDKDDFDQEIPKFLKVTLKEPCSQKAKAIL